VEPLTLALAGDVMLGRGIDQILSHPCSPELHEPYVRSAVDYVRLAERRCGRIGRPVDPAYVWGDALEALAAADLRIVNLETAVTRRGEPAPKGIHYRTAPEHVAVLRAARIDAVSLANNHVLDWGPDGLLDTLAALDAAGILPCGAGTDLAEATASATLAAGERRVRLIAAGTTSSGIGPEQAAGPAHAGVHLLDQLDASEVARLGRIAEAGRRPGDLVVASLHWGGNWGHDVPVDHRAFARSLVEEAGVDVVHGHSSHHPMAVEVHRGRPILYGCGDLVNDYEGIAGHEAYRSELVLVWRVTFVGDELSELRLIPFRLRRLRLERAADDDVAWLADTLDTVSAPLGTRVVRDGDDLVARW
jgi:poly-gamma-glutamate synthesis protein (capsule biosynthesis protein)